MRSVVLLVVVAIGAGALAIRHVPTPAKAEVVSTTRPHEVVSISLDGRRLPLAMLRRAISTQPGEVVDREKLSRDRLALERALVDEGYLTPRVEPARVTFDDAGAAFVVFSIEPGPQFRIRAISVRGATQLDAGVVTLTAGEIAYGARIERARAALADRLGARGKRASVEARLLPEAAGAVDIELIATR